MPQCEIENFIIWLLSSTAFGVWLPHRQHNANKKNDETQQLTATHFYIDLVILLKIKMKGVSIDNDYMGNKYKNYQHYFIHWFTCTIAATTWLS